MVEGAPLLRAYGTKSHRGFESLSLRHLFKYPGLQPVFQAAGSFGKPGQRKKLRDGTSRFEYPVLCRARDLKITDVFHV